MNGMVNVTHKVCPWRLWGMLALCLAMAGCDWLSPGFARFQLLNYTPYDIVHFSVGGSETGVTEAENLLDAPLAPGGVFTVDVAGSAYYWLHGVADTGGEREGQTVGPVWMGDGNVGWAWHFKEGKIDAGMDPELLFAKTDLPAIYIDTGGQAIPDEPKIPAFMHIAYDDDGGPNEALGRHADFSGYAGIEVRGFSSQMFEKKSFGIETWDDDDEGDRVSLLDMPKEEDWVLYGPHGDRSLMRNVLAYGVARNLGWYAPRTRYCELFLNDWNAESPTETYHGVYVLMEKIKRSDERVDIEELEEDDDEERKISGGYLLEMKTRKQIEPGDLAFSIEGSSVLAVRYPRPDRINSAQLDWIQNYIWAFEDALLAPDFGEPDNGYKEYVDMESLIDYTIIHDLFKNQDTFQASCFMYKDRGKKLCMGPVWDFNHAMGDFSLYGFDNPEGWFLTYRHSDDSRAWSERLFQDPVFVGRYIERWFELREDELSDAVIGAMIDAHAYVLRTAQARNFLRWRVLGQAVWPPYYLGPYPDSHQEAVAHLKDWIRTRAVWMDRNIDGLLP